MKRLRFCLTLALALLCLGSGAWTPASHIAASDSLVPASLRDQGGADAWGQVAKLTAADGAGGDRFGNSVSVSGDTVVVGALVAEVGGNYGQGAAYVFYRNQGGPDGWGQVAKLTAADGAEMDEFGYSVSVDGDTAVVGADFADAGGNANQGAAYVFYRDQGGLGAWGQVAKLTAVDGAAFDWFGYSVSVSGEAAVVGALMADVGGNANQGAAYVFYRDQGGADAWGQAAKLTAADGASNDQFGKSVSVDGDTALVGAKYADIGADQGAAYVFYRDQGGLGAWGQVAKLTAADGAAGDQFGFYVSVSGDTAVVGAPYADFLYGANAGAAYVFYREGGGADAWGQVAKLTADDGTESDYFGYSVSVDGDTAVVGAIYAGVGGAAYVFYGEPSIVAPDSVTMSDATQGAIGTSYPFTAIVSPENATLPITYVWQATEQAPVTHTGGLFDSVTFAWATIGTKDINVTATNAGGQVIGTHTIQIHLGIAHVQDISMRYRAFRNGRYDVFADVQVLGQDNLPVHKTTVHILWTLPGGSQQTEQATNKKGLALFKLRSELVGTYGICVDDVVKSGWFYDTSQNLETCDALVVP
jgi:hypothetical protein